MDGESEEFMDIGDLNDMTPTLSDVDDLPVNQFKMVDLAVVKFWHRGQTVTDIEFYDDVYIYKLKGEMELERISRR